MGYHPPMLKEFRDFLARGNVIELAVAVVIGVAFGRIVTTMVDGVLMPPIGMATGGVDFASLFYVLDGSKGIPASLADAKARGIPVIAWGQLVNEVLTFVIVAFAVFLLVKQVNRMRDARAAADALPSRACPECLSVIPLKATRCAQCTAVLRPA